MLGRVIKPFFDLSNPSDVYAVGDIFEGTDERVTGLVQKGFLEPYEPEKAQANAPQAHSKDPKGVGDA